MEREDTEQACKSGLLVVVTMAGLWLWPEGRGVGCWVSEGCVHKSALLAVAYRIVVLL